MVTWVLDTSVVAKWFLPERGSNKAAAYLEQFGKQAARVAVPTSLAYELANVLWVRRRDELERGEAEEMWEDFAALPLSFTDWAELLPGALALGYEHEVSPYDAVFVVLAENLGCDFITADRKTWKRLREAYPRVKLL